MQSGKKRGSRGATLRLRVSETENSRKGMIAALSVSEPLTEPVDVLFWGCSYYAFDVDESVKSFITANAPQIGRVVCIGTSAMMRSMKKPIRRVADGVGVIVAEEEFHCRGEFGKFHRGRPNGEDLQGAAEFAKGLVG